MIKRIKYVAFALVLSVCLLRLAIFIIRLPSYNIQTTGSLYIFNKVSKNIQVFDLDKGRVLNEIPIDLQSFDAVVNASKDKIVMTNYGEKNDVIKVLNLKTNTLEKSIGLDGTTRTNGIVAWPNSDNVGLVDLVNNHVMVLNIKTGHIENKIPTQQQKSHLIALHPTRKMAYVTNIDSGSVSVIDLELEKVVKIIPCGHGRKAIEVTPDGTEVWISNTNQNLITVVDTKNNEVIDTLKTGNNPLRLKFSTDGRHCLVANALGGNIFVYDQQSKKKIVTIHLRGKRTFLERVLYSTPRPVNIAIHPNGLYAFVTNSNAKQIEVVDMKTFAIVSTIGTGKMPDALALVE